MYLHVPNPYKGLFPVYKATFMVYVKRSIAEEITDVFELVQAAPTDRYTELYASLY